MAAAEEGSWPLQYQALALKVSIHCEGCKKKVKKALQSIEGVYKTDIDMQQQKVVVIGNVPVDALVKKLVKTGKHAEPWPAPAADNQPDVGGSGKKKKKKKNSNPTSVAPASSAAAAPEKHDHPAGRSCDEASDQDEPGSGGDAHDGGMVAPLAAMAPITNANASASSGGGKKKKKKSGNSNGNANGYDGGAGANHAGAYTAAIDPGFYSAATATVSYPGYYAGPPPPYAMSYTAHPLIRSSAACYHHHPMVGATSYTGGVAGHLYYSTAAAPASAAPGSYYMFSEENANACSVM